MYSIRKTLIGSSLTSYHLILNSSLSHSKLGSFLSTLLLHNSHLTTFSSLLKSPLLSNSYSNESIIYINIIFSIQLYSSHFYFSLFTLFYIFLFLLFFRKSGMYIVICSTRTFRSLYSLLSSFCVLNY